MKIIESASNQWMKQIKKLHKKKFRDETQTYLIEGEHLVEEALDYHADIAWIITTEEGLSKYSQLISRIEDEKCVIIPHKLLKDLSELPTPQEIIAVVKKQQEFDTLDTQQHYLLLDNIQDPGNLGTMIRTADAAGFSTVVLGIGTTDLYASKVQRAMQGSQFHINILSHIDLVRWTKEAREKGLLVVASALDSQAMSFKELNRQTPTAIIMGNEGQGVSPQLLAVVDKKIYIPMKGLSESLNVAVAAGILMFHF